MQAHAIDHASTFGSQAFLHSSFNKLLYCFIQALIKIRSLQEVALVYIDPRTGSPIERTTFQVQVRMRPASGEAESHHVKACFMYSWLITE